MVKLRIVPRVNYVLLCIKSVPKVTDKEYWFRSNALRIIQ
jgi:hypothetical protein